MSAHRNISCFGVHVSRVVGQEDDIVELISAELPSCGIPGGTFENGDVLLVSSKVCGVVEGQRFPIASIHPISPLADALSKRTTLPPAFAEAVIRDADKIIGYGPHVITTLRKGLILPNSGIDRSNAGEGYFIRFPRDPNATAVRLWQSEKEFIISLKVSGIKQRWGVNLGVIVVDSTVQPLRRGTSGLAIAVAGIRSVPSDINRLDIFGRPMKITTRALADNLCSMAQIVMGEADELRGCPVDLVNEREGLVTTADTLMPMDKCLYLGNALVFNPEVQQLVASVMAPVNSDEPTTPLSGNSHTNPEER